MRTLIAADSRSVRLILKRLLGLTKTFAPVPDTCRCDLVAIGSSTGGPNALAAVIGRLPHGFDKPIVIAQHMPAVFTRYLAQRLDAGSKIRVREATHGEMLEPGLALLAPGDHHMTLRRTAGGVAVVLDQSPPENFCRPAVNVLFRSAAEIFGENVLAVVLTGMGHDGHDGCIALKERGATVLVQDQASSVDWGMPGAVHQSGLADATLTLDDICHAITERASGGARTSARARETVSMGSRSI